MGFDPDDPIIGEVNSISRTLNSRGCLIASCVAIGVVVALGIAWALGLGR